MISAAEILAVGGAWRAAGHRVAVATVVRARGSTPRGVGSRLMVRDDLAFVGSVSSGCVEAAVVRCAGDVIASGQSARLCFGVADDPAGDVGLSCGGGIEIDVELLDDLIAAGQLRCIDIDGHPVIVDPRARAPRLIIIGAVHIAQALAPMARACDYEISVVDPRRRFASELRFPEARMFHDWPDQALRRLEPDSHTAVVALSHDPKIDDPALEAALDTDCFYIGVLGSRRSHARRLERLRARGVSDPELARVRGPVGLDIGAASPAEIAVSILAEMTATLRRVAA